MSVPRRSEIPSHLQSMACREHCKNCKMVKKLLFGWCHPQLMCSIARRRELRELVENSQAQIESLQKQLKVHETTASETAAKLEANQQELERAIPFEKEVKEKNLLIGKLRHEAVILSDHLTKTLRYVKKGKPEDTIDK